MNTNITKTWNIEINEDEVFARCTNESLYQAYMRTEQNAKGDMVVMQEDDRAQFNVYFAHAIANLHMLLARRMAEPSFSNEITTTFVLQMHDNHDNNIQPILNNQWYHADFGSEIERLEINHCLHYRKHPVRRRIGPLF